MSTNCTNCSRGADVAFASIYSLLFMVGLPLNAAALWIFFFRGALWSITTIYMKNLAASDLLLLSSLPLRAYFYSQRPQLSTKVCEIAGLLLLVNMYSSIFLLTCISWDRCMAVCFPLHPCARAFRRRAKYICAGVWTLSILGTIPSYSVHQKVDWENDMLCFDSRPCYIMARGTSSAMLLSFAVPLVITVTCSCSLLRAVHQSSVVHMKLVNGAKIQRMVVTNVAIFLGCFLPYHLVVLGYQVQTLDKDHWWNMAYRWALLLACTNATLDPLAYYFATETFQHLVMMDPLFQGWGNHTRGSEQLSQSLGMQCQPALPPPVFEAPSSVKVPDIEEASASGPSQL